MRSWSCMAPKSGYERLVSLRAGAARSLCCSTTICMICSVQVPLAVDFLAEHVPGIRDLRLISITLQTRLFGKPVMISAHRLHRPASAATKSSARPP